jgi:formate dehydrogenase iron-sulfur subunit
LLGKARQRLKELHQKERYQAQLYGEGELGGLGVFYLLMGNPGSYGIPLHPEVPTRRFPGLVLTSFLWTLLALVLGSWAWKVAL